MKFSTSKYKKCRNCKVYKIRTMFYKSSANKDGLVSYCKPCQHAKTKAWKENSPLHEAWQQKTKLKIYGATPEIYDKLEKDQKGVCAICSTRRLRGRDKHLHMDHDHKSGKIRGLLCHVCNTTLGKFEKWQKQIEDYLQRAG